MFPGTPLGLSGRESSGGRSARAVGVLSARVFPLEESMRPGVKKRRHFTLLASIGPRRPPSSVSEGLSRSVYRFLFGSMSRSVSRSEPLTIRGEGNKRGVPEVVRDPPGKKGRETPEIVRDPRGGREGDPRDSPRCQDDSWEVPPGPTTVPTPRYPGTEITPAY